MAIVFLAFEMYYILTLDTLIKYSNASELSKKFDNKDLNIYIEKKYFKYNYIVAIIIIFISLEFIYFMVGLSKPIINFSIIYIGLTFITFITNKIFSKYNTVEKMIKKANLTDFKTDDIKFQRLLKIKELKKNKYFTLKEYLIPTIKFLIFLTIILMHYKFGIL